MKAILLALTLGIVFTSGAQTFSTGLLALTATPGGTPLGFSAKVEVNASNVTLTLIGASDKWMGIGFGTNSMSAGGDVVIFDGTNLTDRTFAGIGSTPILDANQDWTVTSNTINAGVRTVVGTRALTTADSSDYVFTAAASSLTLVYARGFSMSIGYHGSDGHGTSTTNLALNGADFKAITAVIYPNPSSGSFTIQCETAPDQINIYSHNGKLVKSICKTGSTNSEVMVDNLQSGIYLVEVQILDKKSWNKVIVN